jgi:hypothetical protein
LSKQFQSLVEIAYKTEATLILIEQIYMTVHCSDFNEIAYKIEVKLILIAQIYMTVHCSDFNEIAGLNKCY